MFNKLGRKEAILRLEQESFNRVTVSFYRYIIIENVESFRDKLYSEWKSLSAYGRIYLAKEGVNAQMSVPEHNWDKFVENLNSYDVLKTTRISKKNTKILADSSERLWESIINHDLSKFGKM